MRLGSPRRPATGQEGRHAEDARAHQEVHHHQEGRAATRSRIDGSARLYFMAPGDARVHPTSDRSQKESEKLRELKDLLLGPESTRNVVGVRFHALLDECDGHSDDQVLLEVCVVKRIAPWTSWQWWVAVRFCLLLVVSFAMLSLTHGPFSTLVLGALMIVPRLRLDQESRAEREPKPAHPSSPPDAQPTVAHTVATSLAVAATGNFATDQPADHDDSELRVVLGVWSTCLVAHLCWSHMGTSVHEQHVGGLNATFERLVGDCRTGGFFLLAYVAFMSPSVARAHSTLFCIGLQLLFPYWALLPLEPYVSSMPTVLYPLYVLTPFIGITACRNYRSFESWFNLDCLDQPEDSGVRRFGPVEFTFFLPNYVAQALALRFQFTATNEVNRSKVEGICIGRLTVEKLASKMMPAWMYSSVFFRSWVVKVAPFLWLPTVVIGLADAYFWSEKKLEDAMHACDSRGWCTYTRSLIMDDVAWGFALGLTRAVLDFTHQLVKPVLLALVLPVYLGHALGYLMAVVAWMEVRLHYLSARFKPMRDWLIAMSRLMKKVVAPISKIEVPDWLNAWKRLKVPAQAIRTLVTNRLDLLHKYRKAPERAKAWLRKFHLRCTRRGTGHGGGNQSGEPEELEAKTKPDIMILAEPGLPRRRQPAGRLSTI